MRANQRMKHAHFKNRSRDASLVFAKALLPRAMPLVSCIFRIRLLKALSILHLKEQPSAWRRQEACNPQPVSQSKS